MEYKTAIVEKTDAEPWQAYGMNVLVAAKRVACSDQSKRVVMVKKVYTVPVWGELSGSLIRQHLSPEPSKEARS
jgi:hypothetical protein